jgi:hypothetical protein
MRRFLIPALGDAGRPALRAAVAPSHRISTAGA